jgi:N-acetylmuramic acid 6-phosphate etherase
MVDVAVTNSELQQISATRILSDLTGLDREGAMDLLDRGGQQVKLALMMHLGQLEAAAAAACLAQHDGHLAQALAAIRPVQP